MALYLHSEGKVTIFGMSLRPKWILQYDAMIGGSCQVSAYFQSWDGIKNEVNSKLSAFQGSLKTSNLIVSTSKDSVSSNTS